MANKAISELPQAQNVNNQDLFVLEQSGIAKKLTAETFITEQGIIDALAEALDGHGGIQSVTLSSVSGRVRTYLITFTDGSATTFQVYDGTSIDRIVKTSTAGLVDTYTVFMNDGTTTFFTVTNGADGTVSEAMLNDALKDKAPAITETTESSAIANFTDGADNMVMHHVIAEINPVQSGSGDPSPDNIRPITGWTGCNVTRTGKNLYDANAISSLSNHGVTATVNNGVITFNGTATANAFFSVSQTGLFSGEYVFSFNNPVASNGVHVAFRTTSGAYFSDTFTSEVNKSITIRNEPNDIILYVTSGTTLTNFVVRPQLELGSTATTYEPYIIPSTVSLSWQTEAGTVYGGTIDVATGLLTVTHGILTISDFGNPSSGTSASGLHWADTPTSFGATLSGNSWCSMLTQKDGNSGWGATSPCYAINTSGSVRIYITETTKAAMESAYADLEIVYPLATPQTYQLTPQEVKTLLGTNNVWSDIGNVSVTYPCDTKMFIEKLTIPTEDDLVANQAITSGKYFMIGNSLYLALANIASGAQITIGTNAQRVSLADALNTINS